MLVRTLKGPPPKTPLPRGTVDAQMHMYLPGFPAISGGPDLPAGSLPDAEQYRSVMRWLGIAVPRWLENELLHAEDTLRASVEVSLAAFEELLVFAHAKGIRLGCNVESVALGLAEIEASARVPGVAAQAHSRVMVVTASRSKARK